ncbi:uncharacterized protein YktB (UPF0637 family) [Alkalihalobacillus xiaoxiensis]|uniref:UPF0637 protein JOC54_000738 n=1 Tax=Shouchella xiaoxiensis TaxID=766895 RepID=A0ABS2STA1_9BACI|nr:DUF1054 domain-containing protein [Shouchella xiaoxiensis]MBM7837507.1 uncharacterized protein YktB (UPF0637 family) [Shouchella xiaoxiensis]
MKQFGFSQADFDTFSIDGLEPRMEAIRSNIQPKFQVIGEELRQDLEAQLGNEMYLHIAQHARRTTNPPADTWLAVAANKRGYKKHPHFQVGLFDDHLFIWLAFIYELPGKQSIAKHFLEHQQSLKETIPAHYMVSLDHTKKKAERFDELDLSSSLERFRDVKKAEWLVGQHFSPDSAVVKDGALLIKEVKQTVNKLLPLYKLAHQSLK